MRRTIVIKVGGGAGIDVAPVCAGIPALVRRGDRVVLVHGGSDEANRLAEALGAPPRTITSPSGHTSRRTDREAMEIFEMAYCGKVNKGIVERLRTLGVDAIGLSGLDGGLWTGERKGAIRSVEGGRTVIIRDDLSGRVERVRTGLLETLMGEGFTSVLTPPAWSTDRRAINVDADRAAAATATALGADALVLLSNVPGLLRDVDDPSTLIGRVEPGDIEAAHRAARGRMKN